MNVALIPLIIILMVGLQTLGVHQEYERAVLLRLGARPVELLHAAQKIAGLPLKTEE